LQIVHQQTNAFKKSIIIIPKKSKRTADCLTAVEEGSTTTVTTQITQYTHDKMIYDAYEFEKLVPDAVNAACVCEADLICVDEIQFFDKDDLKTFITLMKYIRRKDACYFGLHADKNRDPFIDFNFAAMHMKIRFIAGPCCHILCKEKATHTFSFDQAFANKTAVEGVIRVGTLGYYPVCDLHYELFSCVNGKSPSIPLHIKTYENAQNTNVSL